MGNLSQSNNEEDDSDSVEDEWHGDDTQRLKVLEASGYTVNKREKWWLVARSIDDIETDQGVGTGSYGNLLNLLQYLPQTLRMHRRSHWRLHLSSAS